MTSSEGSIFDFEPFLGLLDGFVTEVAVIWDAVCEGSFRSFFLVRSLENDDVAVLTSITVSDRRSRLVCSTFASGGAVEVSPVVAVYRRARFRRGLFSWLERWEDTFVVASAGPKAFLAPQ